MKTEYFLIGLALAAGAWWWTRRSAARGEGEPAAAQRVAEAAPVYYDELGSGPKLNPLDALYLPGDSFN